MNKFKDNPIPFPTDKGQDLLVEVSAWIVSMAFFALILYWTLP